MPTTETEKAKAAYGEYEAMGPERSLGKLAQAWGSKRGKNGGAVKLRNKQLERWSSQHNWQARVAAYEEAFRAKQQTAAEKARLENLGLVRAAKGRLAESLKGRTFKADCVADMERLVKLEMQLLGEPLADKHEVSGDLNVHDDAAASLHSRMSSLAARLGVGGETGEVDGGGEGAA
jgi:hypothetical protein